MTHISNRVHHISLWKQFPTPSPELVLFFMDLDKEENIQFVKQHSVKWFDLCKQARITGSIFNSAIGLDTLSKQKEHPYVNVHGRKPAPIPAVLQKKI